MCGIAGFLGRSPGISGDSGFRSLLERMVTRLEHRGPDSCGLWVEPEAGVALGHRRLSILDLSDAGHQPMLSPDGRWVLVYNGEIYNFLELRHELVSLGHGFRGGSDTEILLAAIRQWGVAGALPRLNGMFAFALWDKETQTLTLARDRFGEKPLFYGLSEDGVLLFGSELKALRAYPRNGFALDRDSLTLFFRHAYVPAPRSIYSGVLKLKPGYFLEVKPSQLARGLPEPVQYWSYLEALEQAKGNPFQGSPAEALEQLDRLLRNSVEKRMISDVPLGAFLSGGYDSSLVVAIMQQLSRRPIRTFTIGFHQSAYNEADHAKAVARHLGTEHTELYVSERDALDVIPHLPRFYDEPMADSSQIPTYLVSKMARAHVTTCLSGDAGDELFGGYVRYQWATRIWNTLGAVPYGLRLAAAGSLGALPPAVWDGVGPLLPAKLRVSHVSTKAQKLFRLMRARGFRDLYLSLVSQWLEPERLVLGNRQPEPAITELWNSLPPGMDSTEKMMVVDLLSYLPDDILAKVDRASMAVSLEARVPFLDPEIVDFAWRLPRELKIREGQSKWPIRGVLDRYVPRELMERPKMGFGVPLGAWLRGPLREWAEDLLAEKVIREDGYLDPLLVRQKWRQHLSGRRAHEYELWNVLMFQAWLREQRA